MEGRAWNGEALPIGHEVEDHGVVHALRVDGHVGPTRQILVLKEVAQKTRVLELGLVNFHSLSDGRSVELSRNGKCLSQGTVHRVVKNGVQGALVGRNLTVVMLALFSISGGTEAYSMLSPKTSPIQKTPAAPQNLGQNSDLMCLERKVRRIIPGFKFAEGLTLQL